MPKLAPLEIQALVKIMDELDYYQILHLEPSASASEIKRAFHGTSRTFHPDVNRHLAEEMIADCSRISKRLTEAYCVLRDPRRRKAYDQRLEKKEGLRIQLSEAKAAHAKQDVEERHGSTPQGRQFHQRAAEDMSREDWAAAERNLKMALTFEPANAFFKELIDEVKKSK